MKLKLHHVFLLVSPVLVGAAGCSSDNACSSGCTDAAAHPDVVAEAGRDADAQALPDSQVVPEAGQDADAQALPDSQVDAPDDAKRDAAPDVVADGPSDADACPSPNYWVYESAGCGVSVPAPRCIGPSDDACLGYFCGCDGVTITGCGRTTKPFAHTGPCGAGDAAADVADAGDADLADASDATPE